MTCMKCGNPIPSGAKCFQCGNDNNIIMTQDSTTIKKYRRGPALITVMSLFIIVGFFILLSMIGVILKLPGLATVTVNIPRIFGISGETFFLSIPGAPPLVLAIITMIATVSDIVLCIFIIKLQKWAFKAYVGLFIVGIVTKLPNFLLIYPLIALGIMVPYFLKGLLLIFIYMTEVKHFEKV